MALVVGTNCGFVATAPTADPQGTGDYIIDFTSYAFKDVAPVGAMRVSEIGWWCNNACNAADSDVGIYSHNAGSDKPGTRLGLATFPKGTTAGWKKAAVNIAVTAETIYWMGAQCDEIYQNAYVDQYSILDYRSHKSIMTSALPFTWTQDFPLLHRVIAIYAVWKSTPAVNMKVNIADVWKDVESMKINIGDVWKDVVEVKINIGDTWKTVF